VKETNGVRGQAKCLHSAFTAEWQYEQEGNGGHQKGEENSVDSHRSSPWWDDVLPVPFGRRPLLDLPIGAFEVIHDCPRSRVLLILKSMFGACRG
jgi:hypothetical protein